MKKTPPDANQEPSLRTIEPASPRLPPSPFASLPRRASPPLAPVLLAAG